MMHGTTNIKFVEIGQTCSTYGRYEECRGCMVLVQRTEVKKSIGGKKRCSYDNVTLSVLSENTF